MQSYCLSYLKQTQDSHLRTKQNSDTSMGSARKKKTFFSNGVEKRIIFIKAGWHRGRKLAALFGNSLWTHVKRAHSLNGDIFWGLCVIVLYGLHSTGRLQIVYLQSSYEWIS